jgi:hypothetical protein
MSDTMLDPKVAAFAPAKSSAPVHSTAQYDSGWKQASNNPSNEILFQHGLGVIPSQISVMFSANQNEAYPVLGYWGNNSTGNPVSVSIGSATIALEIFSGAPLHGAWLASNGVWTLWNQGYFRVFAWK